MKLMSLTVALAATLGFVQSAQARAHHHHRLTHHEARGQLFTHHHWVWVRHRYWAGTRHRTPRTQEHAYSRQNAYHGRYGGRPSAWCGWEMRQLVSSDPGPAFNLARNWARWGSAGPAGVGAVVVWPHHVGKIVGREGAMWVIQSGNDGHRMRTRPRSIAGAIAFRWG